MRDLDLVNHEISLTIGRFCQQIRKSVRLSFVNLPIDLSVGSIKFYAPILTYLSSEPYTKSKYVFKSTSVVS